jgi:hypothetical protein
MKKKNNKMIWVIAIVALLAIGFYFYSQKDTTTSGITASGSESGVSKLFGKLQGSNRGNNGWYNAATDECWSTPTALNGGTQPEVECCFDIDGYQADCKDMTKRLSDSQYVFALYWPDYPTGTESAGMFNRAMNIVISNTNTNTPIEDVWISSAVWSSSNTAGNTILNNAWARLTVNGSSNSYSGPVAVGQNRQFPAGTVNLQTLDNGSGTVYTLTMVIQAQAYGSQIVTNQTIVKQMKVTKQAIGMNVSMTW